MQLDTMPTLMVLDITLRPLEGRRNALVLDIFSPCGRLFGLSEFFCVCKGTSRISFTEGKGSTAGNGSRQQDWKWRSCFPSEAIKSTSRVWGEAHTLALLVTVLSKNFTRSRTLCPALLLCVVPPDSQSGPSFSSSSTQ